MRCFDEVVVTLNGKDSVPDEFHSRGLLKSFQSDALINNFEDSPKNQIELTVIHDKFHSPSMEPSSSSLSSLSNPDSNPQMISRFKIPVVIPLILSTIIIIATLTAVISTSCHMEKPKSCSWKNIPTVSFMFEKQPMYTIWTIGVCLFAIMHPGNVVLAYFLFAREKVLSRRLILLNRATALLGLISTAFLVSLSFITLHRHRLTHTFLAILYLGSQATYAGLLIFLNYKVLGDKSGIERRLFELRFIGFWVAICVGGMSVFEMAFAYTRYSSFWLSQSWEAIFEYISIYLALLFPFTFVYESRNVCWVLQFPSSTDEQYEKASQQ